MTIEIDDSGTGDLIGPAFILFWRRETNTLIQKEVPLRLYQNPNFNELTKSHIRDLFKEAFEEMQVPTTEDIYLCTGPCFDEARKFLQENQYNYFDAKIEGYLQDQVELAYRDYLISEYNFPEDKFSLESGKKRFFAIYHWLTQDFPRREFCVKSGFEKWNSRWRDEAELEWMHRMVKPDIREEDLLEDHTNNVKVSTPSPSRIKTPRRGKKSSSRTKAPRKDQKKKSFNKSPNPHSKNKTYSKKRTYRKRSSPNQTYSSTDPDPKNKFY